MVLCPECENEIDVEEDELDEGEVVSCDECGMEFEVVGVDPLELALVADEEEEEDEEDAEEKEEEEDRDF
jgi:alpha-aminoadipate carrier protein LysW